MNDPLRTTPYHLQRMLDAAEKRARDAEQDSIDLMHLLADIRTAAGDPQGKLMQDELVERILGRFQSSNQSAADGLNLALLREECEAAINRLLQAMRDIDKENGNEQR